MITKSLWVPYWAVAFGLVLVVLGETLLAYLGWLSIMLLVGTVLSVTLQGRAERRRGGR